MTAGKMHADELHIDAALVARLIVAQFPQWADLPVTPVRSAGTDNALYRLGDELAVRLPRRAGGGGQVEKEGRWLPFLAPHLPLAIPAPLALGAPGEGYPRTWSVYRWLEGEAVTLDRLADQRRAAADLARFVAALQRIDSAGGPPPGPDNGGRGGPLAPRDAAARAAIVALEGMIDTGAAAAAWDAALRAPMWDGPPVWLHGDLLPGNLLAARGQLSAVIDFGCLGVGDPACDLMPAWAVFTAESRAAFREALPVDDATLERGRGWALSFGLIALPYYQVTNPALAAVARHAIAEVLADHRRGA